MTRTKNIVLLAYWATLGLIASPFVAAHVSSVTRPEILKENYGPDASTRRSGVMEVACRSEGANREWRRGLFTGGTFHDRITGLHPIGSPAAALRARLENDGFDTTPCGDAIYAEANYSSSFLTSTRAEIAWRQDADGNITEIGVQYGHTGL